MNHELVGDETLALMDDLVEEVCWRLVGGGEMARIAFVLDDQPEVLGVDDELMGETVVVPTAEGSMLHSLRGDSSMVLEIDGVDCRSRSGWSVLVHGVTRKIDDDLLPVVESSWRPWATGSQDRWQWIVPDSISGSAISRSVPPAENSHQR